MSSDQAWSLDPTPQPESQTTCLAPGVNLRSFLDRSPKKQPLGPMLVWIGDEILLPPTTHLVATVDGLTSDAYTSKNTGYASASGKAHTFELVPTPGKWVQHLTHAWSNPIHLCDGQIGSQVHTSQAPHIEYCPRKHRANRHMGSSACHPKNERNRMAILVP